MNRALRPEVGDSTASAPDAGLKDPVCGMAVTSKSFHWLQHAGQRLYFCSAGCKQRFAANPAKFAASPTASDVTVPAVVDAQPPAAPAAIYTCPMHPEVRQDRPGACPKCGMALEPLLPTLDVMISGGAGIEYFTRLRHFVIGVEANFNFMALTQSVGFSVLPTVKYAF